MDYDGLKKSYWQSQAERIEQLRRRISERPEIGSGRVVPEDDTLRIGDGKRMNMAVMFIDICDFSSRKMETTAEQDLILRTLNLFFTEMTRIAEEYGGHVEKNTGDGLLIYFVDNEGDPKELGAKRAVAAALTMMASNAYLLGPILKASHTEELAFRVSIDYGKVTIARLGPPRRYNANVAIGTTANFASKMLKHAGKNEIVLGEEAKKQLPIDWQILWTEPHPSNTGWVYRQSQEPYLLYKYTGRWRRVID